MLLQPKQLMSYCHSSTIQLFSFCSFFSRLLFPNWMIQHPLVVHCLTHLLNEDHVFELLVQCVQLFLEAPEHVHIFVISSD